MRRPCSGTCCGPVSRTAVRPDASVAARPAPLGDGRCGDVQERVDRVHIDDPSAPAVRSFVAGRQHAERADPPGHRVAERHRREDRFAVGVPREVGQTGECLTERPGAREVGVRTVETETCDAHEDEAGVDLGESIPRQTASLHLVREQVHDEDVDVRHEPAQEVASCLRCQIDRDRTLVASQDRPHRPSSVRVPTRRLHLDHVGAVVGEQRRDERSGVERRSIDDTRRPSSGPRASLRALCPLMLGVAEQPATHASRRA